MFEIGDIVQVVPFDEIEPDGYFRKRDNAYFGIPQPAVDERIGIDFIVDLRYSEERLLATGDKYRFECYRLRYADSGFRTSYKWKDEMLCFCDKVSASDFKTDDDAFLKFISEVI